MRRGQMVEYVEGVPTTKELLEFRLFYILFFLLLWLTINVDDLRLSGRLLLNHTLHDNDIVIVVGIAHLGHANRHRYGWQCWIVCGCKREVRFISIEGWLGVHGVGD
jgi:hypothetical protein